MTRPARRAPYRARVTLGDSLSGRDNALNFVRLLLAVGVVVSHAWPLGGFEPEPGLGGQTLGTWCVAGFFAISGHLIPGSRQRLTLRTYAIRRALRIFPGLWVCLAVVAFGLAPVAARVAQVHYDIRVAADFALLNATASNLRAGIGHELDGVPFPRAWDGPLWSLQYEVLCYLVVGLVVSRSSSRRASLATAVALGVLGTSSGGAPYSVLAYFSAGWVLGALRERVRVCWELAAASVVWVGVVVVAGAPLTLAALPVAYLVLAFGATSPLRWGSARDLSYGVYIYAFPAQQMLALGGVQRAGTPVFVAASLAVALPLAWLSWSLVEAPALRFAHGLTARRPAGGPPVGAEDLLRPGKRTAPDCVAADQGPLLDGGRYWV